MPRTDSNHGESSQSLSDYHHDLSGAVAAVWRRPCLNDDNDNDDNITTSL